MRWTQVKMWGCREWRCFKRCRIPSTWPTECGKEVKKRLRARRNIPRTVRSVLRWQECRREWERRGVEEGSECSNVVWFGEERQQAELEEAEVDMLSNQDGSRSWMRTLKGQHTVDVFKIKPGVLWHERVKLSASLLTNLPTLFWKKLFFIIIIIF